MSMIARQRPSANRRAVVVSQGKACSAFLHSRTRPFPFREQKLQTAASKMQKREALANDWDPRRYRAEASFVYESVCRLIELLAPAAGERILDLGCGPGDLTLKMKELGCDVVGVDSNPAMTEAANEKGVDARVMDGHEMEFKDEFDAVFSNAALHWMVSFGGICATDVHKSLKPGGRFVGEFGGQGNVQTFVDAISKVFRRFGRPLPSPWYFPCSDAYIALLESEGFAVESAVLFPRPTPFPAGPGEWLRIFGMPFLAELTEAAKQEMIEEIVAQMEPLPVNDEGVFCIDYKRLRFCAKKKRPRGT